MSLSELKTQVEVQAKALPPASLETLESMRKEQCTSKEFHLQTFQLLIRRILSPDSPKRNMLLFHGTGVGKTCTAIQVAEEYILRPEFQDKKVLVLSSASVQSNFRTQIFDVHRVKEEHGVLRSQQCTGRRYLDMLDRAQSENLRWEDPDSRDKLGAIVDRMIDEFYEFGGYVSFANKLDNMRQNKNKKELEAWIHETFDGRMLIVDEAHNVRESPTVSADKVDKKIPEALKEVVKVANGMTLVLLTATPMYDTYEEIVFLFNLFLWNDKRQAPDEQLTPDQFFKDDGFKSPEAEAQFRGYAHEYVSFIRGENPFTFPFRLPPPAALVAPRDRTKDNRGKDFESPPLKYLDLVASYLESPQRESVEEIRKSIQESMFPCIVVSPDGRPVSKCFDAAQDTSQANLRYRDDVIPFLSISNVKRHATKFATILDCIKTTQGIVFVYSNYIQTGTVPFAMCLEEHGYKPAVGHPVLENPSGEFKGTPPGKYAMLTSDMSDVQIEQLVSTLRSPANSKGELIKVIVGSPLISEGLDFKNIRQVHIVDPWYNMSRIEQVVGRGLRTCSHSSLGFKEQNCTVYLHVTRYSDSPKETYDETVYRTYVESKAKTIAFVRRVLMESAIDCTVQAGTNQLPEAWKNLVVTQTRAQDKKKVELPLYKMSAPTFDDNLGYACAEFPEEPDPSYVRPLSSYLEVRDVIFDRMIDLFKNKPIWKQADLVQEFRYDPSVVSYILDDAVQEHLRLRDSGGRVGILERRGKLYAFSPDEASDATMVERSVPGDIPARTEVPLLPEVEEPPAPAPDADAAAAPATDIPEHSFAVPTEGIPDQIKEWFVVDQVMKPEDKIKYLLAHPDKPYASGLMVEELGMMVLGEGKLYSREGLEVDPVGEQLDAFNVWKSRHKEAIVREVVENQKIRCTTDNQKLKIAAFEVDGDGHAKVSKRAKTILPKECSFFLEPSLIALVKDITGHDFPAGVKTKGPRCEYLSLVARMPSEKTYWILPEVWAAVKNDTDLKQKLKA